MAQLRLTSQRRRLELAAPKLPIQFQRFPNDAERVGGAKHVLYDNLLVLERLVILEEAGISRRT
jgi:hypothetical protein